MKTNHKIIIFCISFMLTWLHGMAAPTIKEITGPYTLKADLGNNGGMKDLNVNIVQGNSPDKIVLDFTISIVPLGEVNVNANARYADGVVTLYANDINIDDPSSTVSLGHIPSAGADPTAVESISGTWNGNGFTFDPDDCLILKVQYFITFTVVASKLEMIRMEEEKPTCKFIGSAPGNGAVVKELSQIITYWHHIDERVVVVNRPIPLYDGTGTQVSTGRIENTSDTTCMVTFNPIITDAGNYTVAIPEGIVTTRSGEALNSEVRLHIIIADVNFIPNIEAIPDDYTLSFVLEPNGNLTDIASSIVLGEKPNEVIVNLPITLNGTPCNLAVPSEYKDGVLTMRHNENDLISSPLGDLKIGFYRWKEAHTATEPIGEVSAHWNGGGFSFNPDDCISVKSAIDDKISILGDNLVLTKVNETIYKCSPVSFDYDGRYLELKGNGLYDAIYYSTNPEVAPENGTLYEKPFDVGSINAVIRAVALKTDYLPSDLNVFTPGVYGLEGEAWVKENNTLQAAYYWLSREQQTKGWPHLMVHGYVDEASYGFIEYLQDLRHLDLSDAVSASIPDFSLRSTGIVSISLPKGLQRIGNNSFFNNTNLAALIWNSDSDITEETANRLSDALGGKGVLFYIDGHNYHAALNGLNVIKDGIAQTEIRLKDSDPWYCPREFRAGEISFTKKFTKKTPLDGCAGWETIALPFDAGQVAYGQDSLYPFGSNEGDGMSKRFWLYDADYGWHSASGIKANVPYLIAMPNNEAYYAPYNITGDVRFSATNLTVPATPEPVGHILASGLSLYANYLNRPNTGTELIVNDEYFEGSQPGSIFQAGERAVRPFECYVAGNGAKTLSIMDIASTALIPAQNHVSIWSEGNAILVKSPLKTEINVTDLSGRCVARHTVLPDSITRIDGLMPGIYIAANKKILVK